MTARLVHRMFIGTAATAVLGVLACESDKPSPSPSPTVASDRSTIEGEAAIPVDRLSEGDKGGSPGVTPEEKPPVPEVPKMPRLDLDPAREMHDPNPAVRQVAVEDLARNGSVESLADAVSDPDVGVGFRAGELLGELYRKGQVPVEVMIEKASDASINFKARMGVLSALSMTPNKKAATYLLNLLETGIPEERRMAAGMIGYQGSESAVPALIDALDDQDEWVRYNANEALQHLSRGRDFGQNRAAWQAWWSEASTLQVRKRRAPTSQDRP